jgi:hypothetical protein
MQKSPININITLSKRNIIFYAIFIIAGLAVIIAFITARSYKQLVLATFFYPLLVYFGLILFPRKAKSIHPKKLSITPVSVNDYREEGVIADINKRTFLKLAAGAGISYLLYSIFIRKTESLLPGGLSGPETVALQDPNGETIHPAESQPTDGYQIAEIDEGETSYFGFIDADGAWFIMKEESAGSFRYTKGESGFPTNWSVRKQLKYDYYHRVFP